MKTFKGFIAERTIGPTTPIAWQKSLSKALFDVGVELNTLWLPMAPSIFKRIGIENFRATAFHVTDNSKFKGIEKMQGQKRSLSAAFTIPAVNLEQGIQTKGGTIVELDANVLSSWKYDVMSTPDKSGRRWIQMKQLHYGNNDIDKILRDAQKMVHEILIKHFPKDPDRDWKIENTLKGAMPATTMRWWMQLRMKLMYPDNPATKTADPVLKKKLSLVIKDYLDGMEKVMRSNVKQLKEIFTSYLNIRKMKSIRQWDEQIVNDIKIKKVHFVGWGSRTDMEEFAKEVGKKYDTKIWDSSSDLQSYISGIAAKETGQ